MVDLTKFEFLDALQRAGFDKEKEPLIRLLRANYPLSAEDKGGLADLLEGKLKRPRGRRFWRATDELHDPDGAAVRLAAYFVEIFKRFDKEQGKPAKGRPERAIRQATEYLKEKGFRHPKQERLRNRLRRSKKTRKKSSTKY
jgi:hypothetical protein